MKYRIWDASLSVGGEQVLTHGDFEICGREKIALVGRNGAGKTTFLRLLAGELELDRDDRRKGSGREYSDRLTIGFLHQNAIPAQELTVDELVRTSAPAVEEYSREQYEWEVEYDRHFTGLGFAKADRKRQVSDFSGGQQTRIALLLLLLQKPELLLLDEPTNHLDLQAIQWLEESLRAYPGAVVCVSHDRFFLDQIAETVYELEKGKLTRYPGNYTAYREQKEKNTEKQWKAYLQQQEEIRHLNELIESFKHKPRKAAFARSRKSILERMEKVERPEEDMAFHFREPLLPEKTGAKWVLEAEHLQIGYDKTLLELSLRIRRGQKIAMIGSNGSGKSTFLKTLVGQLPARKGRLVLGNDIEAGYFAQDTGSRNGEERVLEYFKAAFPAMTEKEARQCLGQFLFSGKETARRLQELSGGERARLELGMLLTRRPNLLLLDEPTNHMDIPARETLESALRAYGGTLLFATHDRYLADRVADALLIFEKGEAAYYPFGYRHYLEHIEKNTSGESIGARVSAENQALIAGLLAVPKGESHRLREISTEEAYRDWMLGQAAIPLQAAEAGYAGLWEACRDLLELQQEAFWMGETGPEEEEKQRKYFNALKEQEMEWTKNCLQWYDMYLKLEC